MALRPSSCRRHVCCRFCVGLGPLLCVFACLLWKKLFSSVLLPRLPFTAGTPLSAATSQHASTTSTPKVQAATASLARSSADAAASRTTHPLLAVHLGCSAHHSERMSYSFSSLSLSCSGISYTLPRGVVLSRALQGTNGIFSVSPFRSLSWSWIQQRPRMETKSNGPSHSA